MQLSSQGLGSVLAAGAQAALELVRVLLLGAGLCWGCGTEQEQARRVRGPGQLAGFPASSPPQWGPFGPLTV